MSPKLAMPQGFTTAAEAAWFDQEVSPEQVGFLERPSSQRRLLIAFVATFAIIGGVLGVARATANPPAAAAAALAAPAPAPASAPVAKKSAAPAVASKSSRSVVSKSSKSSVHRGSKAKKTSSKSVRRTRRAKHR